MNLWAKVLAFRMSRERAGDVRNRGGGAGARAGVDAGGRLGGEALARGLGAGGGGAARDGRAAEANQGGDMVRDVRAPPTRRCR